jgi:hypothetical protein
VNQGFVGNDSSGRSKLEPVNGVNPSGERFPPSESSVSPVEPLIVVGSALELIIRLKSDQLLPRALAGFLAPEEVAENEKDIRDKPAAIELEACSVSNVLCLSWGGHQRGHLFSLSRIQVHSEVFFDRPRYPPCN